MLREQKKQTLKENVWDIVARGYWMFKNGSITKQRTFNKIRHWKLKERSKGQIIFHINQIKKKYIKIYFIAEYMLGHL